MNKGSQYTHIFKVTRNIYEGFIGTFSDNNPLHTDRDFAMSKGFRDVVMHGNILNGFISFFVGECLPAKNVIIHTQSIVYSLPVYLNDELEFNAEITDLFESVNTCEFKFCFINKDGKKVAKGNIQIGFLQ